MAYRFDCMIIFILLFTTDNLHLEYYYYDVTKPYKRYVGYDGLLVFSLNHRHSIKYLDLL